MLIIKIGQSFNSEMRIQVADRVSYDGKGVTLITGRGDDVEESYIFLGDTGDNDARSVHVETQCGRLIQAFKQKVFAVSD